MLHHVVRASLLFLGRKRLFTLGTVHDEVVAPIVFDHSGFDELLHHDSCQLSSFHILGQLHDLLLQRVDLRIFRSLVGLFL